MFDETNDIRQFVKAEVRYDSTQRNDVSREEEVGGAVTRDGNLYDLAHPLWNHHALELIMKENGR